ncbi:MAG: hypothetical protein ABSB25_10450 [Sedimentisphaerales bacterium]|jgi:hypothetical protein
METSRLKHIGIILDVSIILVLLIGIPTFLGLFFGGAARMGSVILSVFMFGVPLTFAYLGLRKMKALIWINLVISIPLVVVSGIFAYEKSTTQILFMPLVLYSVVLAIINFTAIFVFWSEYDSKALIPIGISVATFALCICSIIVGDHVNLFVFNRRISQFEDAIRMIDNRIVDSNPIRLRGEEIPEEYRHLAYFIYGEKKNGILRADFYWGSGFPCKHVAYVYLSNDEIPGKGSDFRKDWYRYHRIKEKWFRVSD